MDVSGRVLPTAAPCSEQTKDLRKMCWGLERPIGAQARPDQSLFRRLVRRAIARQGVPMAVGVGLLVVGGQSGAGHQVSHFPSYYPDEIRIEALDPAAAGRGLGDGTVHAYVGAAPSFAGPLPAQVKTVKSLGSFLILSFNTASARFASADARCAAARGILAVLRDETTAGFVFHPYPVTPHHADYLHHLDRIEAASAALVGDASSGKSTVVGARGQLAEAIVRARFAPATDDAAVVLEAVPVDDLLAADVQFGLWPGPPWAKEGWFHAHRLLAPGVQAVRRSVLDDDYERLVRGEVHGLAERIDLERRLVAALAVGCERVVAGYVLKEESFNDSYPGGVENVAYDSLSGLDSPVFLRTAKLKEYPWNGKLQLAVPHRSDAAWNPVAGFTDVMGRLIWSAIGDPAMISIPFNASWMPNRVQSEVSRTEGRSGGIKVPADAMLPQPGSGLLKPVGARTFGSAKVVYEVLASPFEDGTEMTMADLLYPFAFVYRWGAKASGGEVAHEPRLAAVFGAVQEQLVAIRPLRVDETTHAIAEGTNVVWKTPVLEVYLRGAPGDERQVAGLAAPWSTVPWHLLALMEEAVIRGYAAFSQEEAIRRGIAWMDLVRDQALRAKLHDVIARFEREGYRPEPLKDLVTAAEAQARWRSLRTFVDKNGHFLVANGPYRLKQWGPGSVVLEAVRELSYPLGFGTFDRFVNPPKAVIEAATLEAGEITVRASVEMIVKAGRQYQSAKEPLLRTTTRDVHPLLVVSRYLLVDAEGRILALDKMHWRENGIFAITLPERLPPGQYKVILAIFLDGNSLQPSTRILDFRVDVAGSPG
jgi:hypothetical protein